MKNEDKAWISNYPPLDEWLKRLGARCDWQILYGRRSGHHAHVEQWAIGKSNAIVVVRSHKNGWDIYTPCRALRIDETLADAEVRLGISAPAASRITASRRSRNCEADGASARDPRSGREG